MKLVKEQTYKKGEKIKQILKIGDDLVVANEKLKKMKDMDNEIRNLSQKYNVNIISILSCEDDDEIIVSQYNQKETKLITDMAKAVYLINSIAKKYDISENDLADLIMKIILNM